MKNCVAYRRWRRRVGALLLCGAVAGVAAVCGGLPAGAADGQEQAARVFEMRTYITHPGRLDALNKRFRDHTCRLFEKHGMTLVGFWTPMEGAEAENTLVYLLAFPSREARDAAFKAFSGDPEWQKARRESEADGPIVKQIISQFLVATDYSAMK